MKSLLEFIHNSITSENQELALSALEELSQLKKSDDLFYSCGLVCANLGNFQKSFYYYNKALELNPVHKQSIFDLGALSSFTGDWDNSILYGERLISIDPTYNDILIHVANTHSYLGNYDSSITYFKNALDYNPYNLVAWSDLFLSLNYINIELHERITLRDKFSLLLSNPTNNQISIKRKQKIKIGYVSSDFRNHAVSYFIKGLITKHNKYKFDVYFYSLSSIQDDITETFKNNGIFQDCSIINTESLIQLIKDDDIDILVDLNGFTQSNRLEVFLNNAAPIQITWLGFLNSMGIPSIQYKISDKNLIESEYESYYSEDIIKLENSLVYDPPSKYPNITELPYDRNGFLTFGYFNNLRKLNTQVLDIWIEIFKNHNNCKLIMIKSKHSKSNDNIVSYLNLHGFFNIELKDESSLYTLMENMNEVDIALDPFPHSGGATTAHCLWMGVPVLTIEGKLEFERISSSISKVVGLSNFICKDEQDYIKKGSSTDINELKYIRYDLRNRFPKAENVINDLESKLIDIYELYI